jgi:hypothetical protein
MKRTYLENYVKAYENHFNRPFEQRNDATWGNLQYAGYLLDKYCAELNLPTYYKGAYEKCKQLLKLA